MGVFLIFSSSTLHRGARAFHYRGPSRCGAQAPDAQAQQLWLTGPAAPWHVGSSQTRARTRVSCISRQILNHCATREAPCNSFLYFNFSNSFFKKALILRIVLDVWNYWNGNTGTYHLIQLMNHTDTLLLIFLIEILLTYNIMLVSAILHNDWTFAYIIKWSAW